MATALVIHAHPDDEVFATGAATIGLAEAGWRVVLRVATGGEAGEDPRLPEAVARARRIERLTRSSELLGIAEWDWLAEPGRWIDDGGVAGPRSPAASQTELLTEIRRQLDEVQPELVLSVGSDGLTGHPDHVAIAAAVRRAATVEVLGARVRAEDVRAAHAHLERLVPGRPVGSGRVVGCPDDVPLRGIAGGATAEQRRREALDQYADGLGTSPLDELLTNHLGDGVLLRALFDVTSWQRDLFESEAPAGVR
jgi:LmbE family N-acetylglucosaminyl deacetylase